MSGILARFVAQAVIFGVNIVTKAFAQAYQRAQAGGGAQAASSAFKAATTANRMPLDQARLILNIEKGAEATEETVAAQFQRYYDANDPDKGGSFYIQSKIHNAKEALLEDLARTARTKGSSGGSSGGSSSGSSGGSSSGEGGGRGRSQRMQ